MQLIMECIYFSLSYTKLYKELKAKFDKNYILNNTLAMTFPVDFHKKPNLKEGKIKVNVSNNFNKESK